MSRESPISRMSPISPIRGMTQRVRKLSGESCFHMAGCRGSLLLNLYATSFLFVVSVASDVWGRV
jgi:hypothetical protein